MAIREKDIFPFMQGHKVEKIFLFRIKAKLFSLKKGAGFIEFVHCEILRGIRTLDNQISLLSIKFKIIRKPNPRTGQAFSAL